MGSAKLNWSGRNNKWELKSQLIAILLTVWNYKNCVSKNWKAWAPDDEWLSLVLRPRIWQRLDVWQMKVSLLIESMMMPLKVANWCFCFKCLCECVCVCMSPSLLACNCVCQLQALDSVIRILTTETSQRFIFDISALVEQQRQQNIREKLFR